MSKRVLLVHPEISRTKYNFAGVIENEPLELEYIVPVLRGAGYEAEVFDKAVEEKSVRDKISEFSPDVFYVCGRARQENFMKEYCAAAKRENAVTIAGGIHVQHNWERLYSAEVDYILTTFDVFKILDILELKNPEEITGICYKKEGVWVKNAAEPFDIKRLPLPDRSYFYSHLSNYRYLELLPCAHLRTAYSCAYDCNFCYRSTLNCGKYVTRDIEDVVSEIENIECENIFIIDDDFLISPKRIEKFTTLVKKRGIKKKYVCYGRVDFIINNKELVRGLKEIGFYYILAGLEAIDDKRLDNYNKHTNTDANIECVDFLNDIGINIMGLFIVDLDITARDFAEMYKWIRLHKIKHAAVSIFTPELGLDIYNRYENRIITKNPEHWDYLHVVARPDIGIRRYYFHYYILLIKLLLLAKRQGVYDFLDYKGYLKSFVKGIFKKEKGV
ncbi:B12-binding domain-containing radical SAM protein [Clostridia bacterium]|nr:B12-binding domain-containing radical SAM protein [Clostridia bacterium]